MAATTVSSRPPPVPTTASPPRISASPTTPPGLMPSPPLPMTKKPTSPLLHIPSAARRARNRCISCSETPDAVEAASSLILPEVIVTRRSRTESMCGRIEDDVELGTVKYFCRSRGHGFIVSRKDPSQELFMHISDIEGEFVPRKGDTVSYRSCPIPPKFEKHQAVHVHIVDLAAGGDGAHVRWEAPATPEEREQESSLHSLPYDV